MGCQVFNAIFYNSVRSHCSTGLQFIFVITFILLGPQQSLALPTTLSGADYIAQCASFDVPTPSLWGNSDWTEVGEIGDANVPHADFTAMLNSAPDAVIYTLKDPNAPGTCVALDRPNFQNSGKNHVDIICLGTVSSKACFWENNFVDAGSTVPLGLI